MFMKLGQHGFRYPSHASLAETSQRWRIKDLALTDRSNRLVLPSLKEGYVESNLSLILVERPFSQWTIARANDIMHHQLNDRELAAELAACPLLAPNWRRALFNRAIRGINLDSQPRLMGANE